MTIEYYKLFYVSQVPPIRSYDMRVNEEPEETLFPDVTRKHFIDFVNNSYSFKNSSH